MRKGKLWIATISLVSPFQETNGFSTSRSTAAVSLTTTPFQSTPSRHHLPLYNSYGRGAEIWPERNEDPVQLADSFPNGQVPYSAILSLEETDMAAIHQRVEEVVVKREQQKRRLSKRKMVSKTIRRILRRAAAKEEVESEAISGARVERTPIIIAIGLLARGLVQPIDALLVSFLTGYFIILGLVARGTRENSEAPILPAIPPQGHVPAMVSNPLGTGFLYSKVYDLWLKLGVVLGLVGPLLLLGRYTYVQDNMVAARLCASPIFILCCQAISEAFSRRVMVSTCSMERKQICMYFYWGWLIILDPFSFLFDVLGSTSTPYPGTHRLQYSSVGLSLELGFVCRTDWPTWSNLGHW